MLGRIAAFWGVFGVCGLLSMAVWRLMHYALSLMDYNLTVVQISALIFSVVFMSYAEGYKGFYRAFSPRVVARAKHLITVPKWHWAMFAPLFCMSFIGAPKRRRIISFALSATIICAVVFVRLLPQPWRGIVDAGVVIGLCWGILSILFFCIRALQGKLNHDPEVV